MNIFLFIIGFLMYAAGVYFALFLTGDLHFRPAAEQQNVQYMIYAAYAGIAIGAVLSFVGYLKGTAKKA